MKRTILTIVIALFATFSFAQLRVNVELRTNDAEFENRSERAIKQVKGEAWQKYWEETAKPAILQDIIAELNNKSRKYSNHIEFGRFEESDYSIVVSLHDLDKDGETRASVSLFITSKGAYDCIWSRDIKKDGSDTKDYNAITSKAFVRIIDSASGPIFKNMGFKSRFDQRIME